MIVTCARCGADYPEGSDQATWSDEYREWTCTDMTECDDRAFEARQVKGHKDGF